MGVSTRSIGGALGKILGRDGLSQASEATAAAAIDGVTPIWVARPTTVEQVAAVLALAWDEGLAVSVRGSGTAQEIGRSPARVEVVLDMRALDRVLEDHPEDLTVSVQAGVTAGALADRLAARRQWLPVDPPGWRGRTLGGLAATGTSGPLRVRYGTLRDLLLGVRFVQADGVVTWGGARVVKSVTGYDVPKLLVGSLGTLGVLVELTLRLHPMPEAEGTWIAGFGAAADAEAFVGQLVDSSLQPSRVEFLDGVALRACDVPAARAGIAVGIGSVEAAVREQGARLERLARHAGGTIAAAPGDFWARYDGTSASGARDVVLQVGTLASHLAETVGVIETSLGRLGDDASALVTGCAPLGALRVVITGGEPAGIAAVVERLRGAVAGFGGHVVIQSGPREVRMAVDPWGAVDPAALGMMRSVKEMFDPKRILNAGRFVGGL